MKKKKLTAFFRRYDPKVALAVIALLLTALGAGEYFLQAGSSTTAKNSYHYDVVVVGAGPSGVAAAIQAAKMGEHVALLERTDWIGGQMTAAGVGTMDEGDTVVRKTGIYADFIKRVTAFYAARGKTNQTCYYDVKSFCVDPQVGQTVLRQMLATQNKNLDVLTDMNVTSVLKKDNTVTGVVANNKTYTSKVLIDADEYGDVLAQAGAAYRLSNGTSTSPAKGNPCVQSITEVPVIKYYADGVPEKLKFTQAPPGYSQKIVEHFAYFLKKNGNNFFDVKGVRGLSFKSYTASRGLPDLSNTQDYNVLQEDGHDITRTSLNTGNDYPMEGSLSSKFISDPKYRAQAICDAKLLSVQLMYYIQHDLGETDWSIADDEGYDTSYNKQNHCANLKGFEAFEDLMPQEPYVREGRRLIGTQTLTGDQLQFTYEHGSHTPRFSDSVAVGYYPMDLHSCYQEIEPAFDSGDNLWRSGAGGAFEIPMGVMIPQTVDGLLAAEKNISVSRYAEGAIREQPVAMATGQAAGALAALAAKQHTQPRNVSAQIVQEELQDAGATINVKANY